MGNTTQKAATPVRAAVQAAKEQITRQSVIGTTEHAASSQSRRIESRPLAGNSPPSTTSTTHRPPPPTPQMMLHRTPDMKPFDMDSLLKRAKTSPGAVHSSDMNEDTSNLTRKPLSSVPHQQLHNNHNQIKKKPTLFTYGDDAPLVGADGGGGADNISSKSTSTGDSTVPLSPDAAEVQASVASDEGTTTQTVAVRRIFSSGPAPENASLLHEKNLTTVENVATFDGSIRVGPDTSIGAQNFQIYQAMQMNPSLLDTPQALAQSATAVAALRSLQVTGGLPKLVSLPLPLDQATLPSSSSAATAAAVAVALKAGETGVIAEEKSATTPPSTDMTTSSRSSTSSTSTALVPLTAERIDALLPQNATLDSLLLSHEPSISDLVDAKGRALIKWPSKPPAASPYDQLLLVVPDDEFMLERGELFELYARHRANPSYWTAERLAEAYATKPEWIEVLLKYVTPPIYASVDGDVYGVWDIRPESEFEERAAEDADASSVSAATRSAKYAQQKR